MDTPQEITSIPDELKDERYLVDPASNVARDAAAYMQRITDRLLEGEGIAARERSFRFFLINTDTPHASILRNIVPPAIVVSKGLLATLEHEDELAGILRHEIQHYNMNGQKNNKAQEAICDASSVPSLRAAGYNPLGLAVALGRLPDHWEKSIDTYLDDHPDTANRIRDIESYVSVKERKEGDANGQWTAFDETVKASLPTLPTRINDVAAWLHEHSYQHVTIAEKIGLLDAYLQKEQALPAPFLNEKFNDFCEFVQDLATDSGHPAQKAALDDFVCHIFGSQHHHLRTVYTKLNETGTGNYLYPLGRLSDLNSAIKKFLNAETSSEAEEHAAIINHIAATHKLDADDNFTYRIHFSALVRPRDHFIESNGQERAWEKHIDWVHTSASSDIHHALCRLGLDIDPDLPPFPEYEKQLHPPIAKLPTQFINLLQNSLRQHLVLFQDREHLKKDYQRDKIIDLSLEEEARRHALEVRRMAIKDQVETQLMGNIDWSLLESDFWGFVEKYEAFLTPEITTIAKGGDSLATEFLKRMRVLADAEPGVHRTNLDEFFRGQTGSAYISPLDTRIIQLANTNNIPQDHATLFSPASGVSIHHPFVEFVLEDPYQSLPYDTKANIASNTAFFNVRNIATSFEEQFTIHPAHVFDDWSGEPSFDNLLRFYRNTRELSALYTQHVLTALVHKTLETNPDATLSRQDMFYFRQVAERIKKTTLDSTRQLIARQIDNNRKHELRPEASAQDIANAYIIYSTQSSFAADNELRLHYETAMKEKYLDIQTLDAREAFLQTLLYRKEYIPGQDIIQSPPSTPAFGSAYSGRILNHDFRAWVTNELVATVKDRFGVDDGSEAYNQMLTAKINELRQETQRNFTVYESFPALADALNLQPPLAFAMRDMRATFAQSLSGLSTYVGAMAEITLDEVAKTPHLRLATLDFLTSPVTKESAISYGTVTTNVLRHKLQSRLGIDADALIANDQTLIDHYTQIHQEFWRAPFEARAWYLDKVLFPPREKDEAQFDAAVSLVMNKSFAEQNLTPGNKTELLKLRIDQIVSQQSRLENAGYRKADAIKKQIHELRATYPLHIILHSPEGRRYTQRLRKFTRQYYFLQKTNKTKNLLSIFKALATMACEHVLHRVPRIRAFTKNSSMIMRQVAEFYLDVIPKNEKRLALSAAMAARSMAYEDQQKGKKTSPGKFAAQILNYMDEMGGKILQALDSHPAIPQDFKHDFGDSKGGYQIPFRWDALQWSINHGIQATMTQEEVAYYGPVIGSGSMGYTLAVTTRDGKEHADTILRPHAQQRTEREARNVIAAAEKLAAANPKLAVAPDIAAVAQRDARIETHMGLAYKQGLVAAQVYNGLATSAIVDGKKYSFTHQTADISAYSPAAKRADLVQGIHFNDLPEKTADQRAYKKAAAIQLFGTELFNILSGKPADRDRHGKNQKITADFINHFDFGMTALTLPTDDQKRAMVNIALTAFRNHYLFKKDIAASFDHQIRKLRAPTETKHYLSGFRRQVLSLGDFDKHLSVDDKKQIFAAILQSGRVDPVIRQQISSTQFGRLFLDHIAKTKAGIFSIDDSQCVQAIQMPALTEPESALLRGEFTATAPANARKAQPAAAAMTGSDGIGETFHHLTVLARTQAVALCGLARNALAQNITAGPKYPNTGIPSISPSGLSK